MPNLMIPMISNYWIFNSNLPHPIIQNVEFSIPIHVIRWFLINSNPPNPIIPTIKYSILVQSMNIQLVICLCIHQMNIWSVIRRTPAYTKSIFCQKSAGPLHTPNEYLVTNPPDPCVRQMNIQSDIHPIYLHSLFVILISAEPVCYVNWIFSG